ncbi:MAG: hypothetical protein KJO40_03850 [Deltaproteobacteria bacterium]|nr:hypothetical protein [Deltaproteobacteria bacterium]NND27242.1 hypothetical protein [Myxococcales bacterium]MBT8465185.1 hypothetical protein [Deltaproteobacteria bacterium]NNK08483.1 hypothetical protein [Myxococcales bacterium]NNK41036.1 hypothetical protein [Myxococcales bacterium]
MESKPASAVLTLMVALLMAATAWSQRVLTASPTCEELTIMDFLARLDEESSRYKRGLDVQDRRDLSQLRREVCAPYVGYRVTRQPTTTWSNGRIIVRGYLELNHPNGRRAKSRSGEWFYPSGTRAKSALGRWKYSNGLIARTKTGQWYTRDGKYVEDADLARIEACEYLGRQLCPLGKADEDLLAVTVMGLINKAAPPKEPPPAEEQKSASGKGD